MAVKVCMADETKLRTVEITAVLISFVFLFTSAILGSLKRVEPLFVFLKLSLSRALNRQWKEKSIEKQRCKSFDSFYFILISF